MSRLNGRIGTTGSHRKDASELADYEPACLVQTASGSLYIPPSDISKTPLDYKSSLSSDTVQKTDLQKTPDRNMLNYVPPMPTLPIRSSNMHRPSSNHHFQTSRFHFKKGVTSRCSWKCTAIVLMFVTVAMAATLIYLIMANLLSWSYHCSTVNPLERLEDETGEALAKIDGNAITNSSLNFKLATSYGGMVDTDSLARRKKRSALSKKTVAAENATQPDMHDDDDDDNARNYDANAKVFSDNAKVISDSERNNNESLFSSFDATNSSIATDDNVALGGEPHVSLSFAYTDSYNSSNSTSNNFINVKSSNGHGNSSDGFHFVNASINNNNNSNSTRDNSIFNHRSNDETDERIDDRKSKRLVRNRELKLENADNDSRIDRNYERRSKRTDNNNSTIIDVVEKSKEPYIKEKYGRYDFDKKSIDIYGENIEFLSAYDKSPMENDRKFGYDTDRETYDVIDHNAKRKIDKMDIDNKHDNKNDNSSSIGSSNNNNNSSNRHSLSLRITLASDDDDKRPLYALSVQVPTNDDDLNGIKVNASSLSRLNTMNTGRNRERSYNVSKLIDSCPYEIFQQQVQQQQQQLLGNECRCSCPCLENSAKNPSDVPQNDDVYANSTNTELAFIEKNFPSSQLYKNETFDNVEESFEDYLDNSWKYSRSTTEQNFEFNWSKDDASEEYTNSVSSSYSDNTEYDNVTSVLYTSSMTSSTTMSSITDGPKYPARSYPPDATTFGEVKFDEKYTKEVDTYGYWNVQFYQSEPSYVKFNFGFPKGVTMAVYGRKNALPTHTQYETVELLNGVKVNSNGRKVIVRSAHPIVEKEMIHFLDVGHWFLSIYNDNAESVTVSMSASISDDMTRSCPKGCSDKGECVLGRCKCKTGYGGEDCSQSVCPALCNERGEYINGECHCNPGWKGKECNLRHDECEVADCHGHGQCINGKCNCARGYKGEVCQEVDCPHPTCNGHGFCFEGKCICKKGWKGIDCFHIDNDTLHCLPDCSGHGKFDLETQVCNCDSPYAGDDCSYQICGLDCGSHGRCIQNSCVCDPGWIGSLCNTKICDSRCNDHGQCKNGTCVCVSGWNGKHCTLEGCPNQCNNHGQCKVITDNMWECKCAEGWDGRDCSVSLEQICDDSADNDKDGLSDCEDPECCFSEVCRNSQLCVSAPKPIDILLRKQPPAITASFFERTRFLIEEGSLQNYARQDNFNESQAAVVRGRVVTSVGMGLMGVRVSTSMPLEGFTLTREDGWFDLLVNGGGAIVLQFGRSPFKPRTLTVYVPWNEIVIIKTIVMTMEYEKNKPYFIQLCKSHNYDVMKPVVLATWKHGFQGGCSDKSAILAESQVVQESLQIPGTGLNLIYHSSRSTGYLSTIQLQLTPEVISPTLKLIYLSISIEGIFFEKTFEADPNIRYTYSWNRLNVYRQRVYGVATALVKIGYEYTDCKDIIWDVQTTKLSGNDMLISEVGGWDLDIHHRYNFHEGILQKGDGSNIYLKHKPRIIRTVLGDGQQRPLNCDAECETKLDVRSRLLSPVALAAASDGSIFVGDFNLVRKIFVNGTVRTVVRLNTTKVAYRYNIALSPLDNTLYISDPESHVILRVRDINDFSDPDNNWEIAVGSGERCLPGDEAHCGDGASAKDAKLAYPKGVAVSAENALYFADGTNIRMVDRDGIVTTIIGSHMHKSHWKPMPCEGALSFEEVHLRWPTDLSINPLDNTLHIIDDHVVLQLTTDGRVKIVAGRPLHCPPNHHYDSGFEFATQATLVTPQSIAFAPNGDLYIAESDAQRINRVRLVSTDGRIGIYAGGDTKCNCLDKTCNCYEQNHPLAVDARFNAISSIAVSPNGVLHIADQANYRIRSVVTSIPEATDSREYEVYSPETQELYIFNRFGQHLATKNILTGETSYTFTYNVNTSNGKLSSVTDTAGNKVFLLRDYSSQVNSIENTKGQKCRLHMSRIKMLDSITTPDNYNITFDYHGSTGLLKNKLDSAGRSYIYNYDEFGRLTGAVTPTGKSINLVFDLNLKGAMVKVTYDDKQSVLMKIRGSSVITKTGESEKRIAITNDGGFSATLPWGGIVRTEVVPYPILADIDAVLAQNYPVPSKQKTELGSDVINRFEYKYFIRKGLSTPQQQQKTNSSNDNKPVVVGRKLRVNGEGLITLEYNRDAKILSVYLDDRVELLNVTYDRTARPIKWFPKNSAFASVQLEYDRFSRLAVWRWGSLVEKYSYDRAGRLAEIHYADQSSMLYSFRDMFSTLPAKVTTPRGSDYLLEYNDAGALRSLTTPRGHIHTFCLQTSLGFYKYQYFSPISRHPFELRYNEEGKVLAKLYPHNAGKVTYVYDQFGRIDTVLTGVSSVHYTYQENTNLVKNIDTIAPKFELKHEFRYHVGLLKDEKLTFGTKNNLDNIRAVYEYDGNGRIDKISVQVGGKNLTAFNLKYNTNLGSLEAANEFKSGRNAFNRSALKDNSTNYIFITEHDSYARMSSYVFNMKDVDVFRMELTYDNRSRVKTQSTIYGRASYMDKMAYDTDGHLSEVVGHSNYKYAYDENGNAISVFEHDEKLLVSFDSGDRVVKLGDNEVNSYDARGFVVRRGNIRLSYDEDSRLSHASEAKKFTSYYRYDSRGRLIAVYDNAGNITQLLYTNPHKPDLITVLHYPKTKKSFLYFYDDRDVLVSIQGAEQKYYVVCDQNASPLVLFDMDGNIVKEIRRSPFGHVKSDSNVNFYVAVGFQGAVPDTHTGLLYLNKRWYDPFIGQWMTPNWEKLANKMAAPTDIFVYRFHNNDPINTLKLQGINYMTDLNSWLQVYGFNMENILGSSYTDHIVYQPVAQINSPELAPDFGLISGLQCIMDKVSEQFKDFSFVPQPLLKMESRTRNLLPRVAYRRSIFGEGLLISRSDDSRAIISTVEGVNSVVQDVITSVFNGSYFLDLHFSHHEQDLFFFVKDNPLKIRDDLEELKRLGGMFNVSTHDAGDGKELRLYSPDAQISIRYGTEPQQEKHRLLKHAHKRAVERAWEMEKALIAAGLSGVKGDWTDEEREELLTRGKIEGYDGMDIHSLQRYPELADDPGNIAFKKDLTNGGKRKRRRRNQRKTDIFE